MNNVDENNNPMRYIKTGLMLIGISAGFLLINYLLKQQKQQMNWLGLDINVWALVFTVVGLIFLAYGLFVKKRSAPDKETTKIDKK
jgi:formate-dependent nitrite reductase membrane component NrfD